MAILDQIGLEKQRISQRLMQLDAEQARLSNQLNDVEIAERALRRFGRKGALSGKQRSGRAASNATTTGKGHKMRNGRQALRVSLGDAALQAVEAHAKGASANEVLNYLSRKFGLTVRPNHLGMALQRHRRAGRLEQREQRWYRPRLA
jgi:hypothetical protein